MRAPSESQAGCRWPLGHPREPGFHFCEAKPVMGKPYCPEHLAKAHRPREEAKPRTGGYDIRPTGRVA